MPKCNFLTQLLVVSWHFTIKRNSFSPIYMFIIKKPRSGPKIGSLLLRSHISRTFGGTELENKYNVHTHTHKYTNIYLYLFYLCPYLLSISICPRHLKNHEFILTPSMQIQHHMFNFHLLSLHMLRILFYLFAQY